MNKKIVIISLTAAIMLGGVWFFGGVWADQNELALEEQQFGTNNATGTQLAGTPTATVDFSGNPLIGGDAVATPQVDGEFSISVIYSAEYGFSPETFMVQQGDVVSFNIRSTRGDVSLDIPEYGIALEKMTDTSVDQTVTFVAENKGEFMFSNALGGGQGTIIVE